MVLQYRVMLVVYYLQCQILNVTLMQAMLEMKIHGGALQDTCLRSVVVRRMQTSVALSSLHSEYMAASAAALEALSMAKLSTSTTRSSYT